jgi:predicted O-linked N-acetylglucosamine transferase (SPINDLY family)
MSAPTSADLGSLLAKALLALQEDRLTEAEQLISQAVQLDPSLPDTLRVLGLFSNSLGDGLAAGGELHAAVLSYQQALHLIPIHADSDRAPVHNNLGNSLQRLGRFEEAIAAYSEGLKEQPDHAQLHSNLGGALLSLGQLTAAAEHQARAIALQPDFAEAHNNLGVVLIEQNKVDAAVGHLARAVQLKPDYTEGWNNLASALRRQGKTHEAEAVYRHILASSPDSAHSRLGLLVAATTMMPATVADSAAASTKFTAALDELAAWHSGHPGMLGTVLGTAQPFHLAYRPSDLTSVLKRYGELMCNAASQVLPAARPGPRAVRDRIRLIIVSGHISEMHPVWEIILHGLIAAIDRNQFEIIVYHTSSHADEATQWAAAHVDRFVSGKRTITAWRDNLQHDQPDVIFYPEIGMDPVACALAAHRVAPLQVAGWGHPVTTGYPTLDWFLSGELLEAESAEQHYQEKLLRLPGTGVCTAWPSFEVEPWDAPAAPPDVVRFSLCHQPIKFEPADDVLLTHIAREAGPCEFWLSTPRNLPWAGKLLYQRLAAAFRSAGLVPEQYLRTAPWLTTAQFAGFLDKMDVYLDCPAFSGYSTAWHAVHRGLPIITCEGPFLRQRLAAGLLRQIGITDGITTSKEEYVARAVEWARECRASDRLRWRRERLQLAAAKADGNRAAVEAFERAMLEQLARTSV